MTTTAFQYIFDNAESISIDKRAIVGQTISRDNTVKAVSRGGKVWRFTVKLPDGLRWSVARPYIAAIEYADRYTTGNVQINNAGYNDWLTPYMGNCNSLSGFTASVTTGYSNVTLTANPTISSGYKFNAGDFVQVGSGHAYSVASTVAFDSNAVQLDRPVIETTGSYSLAVGKNITWNLICTTLPNWSIFARDQVSWSGPFTFYEVM